MVLFLAVSAMTSALSNSWTQRPHGPIDARGGLPVALRTDPMTTNARSGPPKDRPAAPAPPPPPSWRRWLIPAGLIITALLLFLPSVRSTSTAVGYGRLTQQIAQKHVESLTLTADGAITGTYRESFKKGENFTSQYPSGVQGADPAFLAQVKNPDLVPHFEAT